MAVSRGGGHPPARHVPRKRFGQHFLVDGSVLARIVAAIAPRPGDNLVEIGPGAGALTRLLLQAHGSLQAVEIDRDLSATLRETWGGRGLTLHQGDVLDFDLHLLGKAPRIVGNLPYNISTPLLFRIATEVDDLVDCVFMLQEEVVDRIAARPGSADYGRLSVMLQARFAAEKLFVVPPTAFRPPPRVQSAIVRLVPLPPGTHAVADAAVFGRLVRDAFSQRRKMLRNALADVLTPVELQHLGVDPMLRPEALSVADYVRLADHIVRRDAQLPVTRADAG